MRNETRIFIFSLKRIVMIIIIAAAALALILILPKFLCNKKEDVSFQTTSIYVPGVYTSSITLNQQKVDLQVVVDENQIKAAEIIHIDDTVAAMYPLLKTSISDISSQLSNGVALEDITYPSSSRYTSQVLLNAISNAVSKARK